MASCYQRHCEPRLVTRQKRKGSRKDGEFLGECSVAMRDVTRDMELTDMFSLEGVKNNAQIFAQFKFSYLS